MIRILLTAVLAVSLAGPVRAQSEGGAIQGVIQSQIEAFLLDDFETAFTFASPMIKGVFGTPDRFGEMVRNGYPMVWRPSDVQFLDLEQRDGALHQKVMVADPQGTLFILDYEMIETEDGWRINGVQVIRAPQVAA